MELTTEQLKARIAELEQQVAELSKDKARLDWLNRTRERVAILDHCLPVCSHKKDVIVDTNIYSGIGIRAALDAAIAKDKEHE